MVATDPSARPSEGRLQRELKVPEKRAGARQVGVEQRVLDHECEPPRLHQSVARHIESLVTFVTSGRRLLPREGRWLRRKGRPPAAFGDVWTPFDSRSGHFDGAWIALSFVSNTSSETSSM